MYQRSAHEPWHEGSVFDRVPEPPAAPSLHVVGPVTPHGDTAGEEGPCDQRPRTGPSRPCGVQPTLDQRGNWEGERNGESDVSHVEHGRMEHHAGVLQERIQIASIQWGGYQSCEGIRCGKHEEKK